MAVVAAWRPWAHTIGLLAILVSSAPAVATEPPANSLEWHGLAISADGQAAYILQGNEIFRLDLVGARAWPTGQSCPGELAAFESKVVCRWSIADEEIVFDAFDLAAPDHNLGIWPTMELATTLIGPSAMRCTMPNGCWWIFPGAMEAWDPDGTPGANEPASADFYDQTKPVRPIASGGPMTSSQADWIMAIQYGPESEWPEGFIRGTATSEGLDTESLASIPTLRSDGFDVRPFDAPGRTSHAGIGMLHRSSDGHLVFSPAQVIESTGSALCATVERPCIYHEQLQHASGAYTDAAWYQVNNGTWQTVAVGAHGAVRVNWDAPSLVHETWAPVEPLHIPGTEVETFDDGISKIAILQGDRIEILALQHEAYGPWADCERQPFYPTRYGLEWAYKCPGDLDRAVAVAGEEAAACLADPACPLLALSPWLWSPGAHRATCEAYWLSIGSFWCRSPDVFDRAGFISSANLVLELDRQEPPADPYVGSEPLLPLPGGVLEPVAPVMEPSLADAQRGDAASPLANSPSTDQPFDALRSNAGAVVATTGGLALVLFLVRGALRSNPLDHPIRIQVLGRLRRGPCDLGSLATALRVARGTMRHHVRILERAGIISVEKISGRRIINLAHSRAQAFAAANPVRAAILDILTENHTGQASELLTSLQARGVRIGRSTLGHHLQQMETHGVLSVARKGRRKQYRVSPQSPRQAPALAQSVAFSHAGERNEEGAVGGASTA